MGGRRGGGGKDQIAYIRDAQGGGKRREDKQKAFGADQIVDGRNQWLKKVATR